MDIREFDTPDFLSSGTSAEEIHGKMLEMMPSNMDKTEGGVLWDLTYPMALALSEVVEFYIVETIKNVFPMWAEGRMLDHHGQNRGLARKAAVAATGTVNIVGKAGYTLSAGTVLSTTGVDESETVLFELVDEVVLDEYGSAKANIVAVELGEVGNVAAGRINRLDIPDENILNIENAEPTSGGLDAEDDEDYRERLRQKAFGE